MGPTLKEEYLFKVIILGESGVGKTALLLRYTENLYRCTFTTIAAQYSSHSLELDPGVCVKLNIWDTCGMEKYRALTRNYYHNVAGCLLVFDLTNEVSFNNIKYWHDDICETQASDTIVFVLVGQKCDDTEKRKVTREDAEQLAAQLGMPYVEVSAVKGDNVEETFYDLARRMKDEGILRDVKLDGQRRKLTKINTNKKCCN